MHRNEQTRRGARRVRALALLGGLTLEALVFGLLLAAAPPLTQMDESPVPAEMTCEMGLPMVAAPA